MLRYGPAFHHGPYLPAWVALALLLALVVIGALAVARLWSGPRGRIGASHVGPTFPPVDPALTELRVRYARGEFAADEYRRRLADLGYPAQGEPGAPMAPPAPPSHPTL